MNQLPLRPGSTLTSKSTLTSSSPASRLLGNEIALPLLLLPPPNVKPSPAFHDAVPATVAVRPLPDESAAVVPLVSSSLYQATRPVVVSLAAAGVAASPAAVIATPIAAARKPRETLVVTFMECPLLVVVITAAYFTRR